MNEFNDWLQKELDYRGWSYAELARRAEMSSSSVSMLFSQNRQPGLELCKAIARAFRISEVFVLVRAGLISPENEPDTEPDPTKERVNYILDRLPENKREEILAMVQFMYDREQGNSQDQKPRMAEG